MGQPTFAIVGAGLAGAKAAETLRAEGFDGRVLLIGDEPERPYERPGLSKHYLRGESGFDRIAVHDADYYQRQDIELRTATPVESWNPTEHELGLGNGERLRYDRLLLATGSAPRRPTIPGIDLAGVHRLRTTADADALRARFRDPTDPARRLVLVGAGWIGAEVAASACALGLEQVVLVDPAPTPLHGVLGTEVGRLLRNAHAEQGVRTELGRGVLAFEGEAGRVRRVRLDDGRSLECDLVVVGVGSRPRTELAETAGLATDNGIPVDQELRTEVPDVFAAGDVAHARHPRWGGRLRVEHWSNARDQGTVAARNMLGQRVPYDEVPYFFSVQHHMVLEYVGFPEPWDEVTIEGDRHAPSVVVHWRRSQRVVAGMALNVPDMREKLETAVRTGTEDGSPPGR